MLSTQRTASAVLDHLYTVLEQADLRLIETRRRKREALKAQVSAYQALPAPIDQSAMSFG